jgi:(2R)-3-sulfolactate dehydrogenase (NADP+)
MLRHCESLLQAMLAQPGVRLPGERRLATRARLQSEGITIPRLLFQDLQRRADDAP